jgi:hypothetical protein
VYLNYAIIDSNALAGLDNVPTNPSLAQKFYIENEIVFPTYGRSTIYNFLTATPVE